MVGSAVVHIANMTSVSDTESAGAVVLDMGHNYFDPAEITFPARQPVKILVRNRDLHQRDIQIAELGVSLTLLPFSEGLIETPALGAGTISITSNYSDQALATLVVQE